MNSKPKKHRSLSDRLHLQLKLTLWKGEDDDLIELLSSLPARGRAKLVKRALRGQVKSPALRTKDEKSLARAVIKGLTF